MADPDRPDDPYAPLDLPIARPFELTPQQTGGQVFTPPAPSPTPPPRAATFTDPREIRRLETARRPGDPSPEEAARLYRLQRQTGFPLEVIRRNADQLDREVARRDFDPETFRRDSPLLASWLASDRYHAALVADDVAALSTLDRWLGRGAALVRQPVAGWFGAVSGTLWGGLQALGDLGVVDLNDPAARERRELTRGFSRPDDGGVRAFAETARQMAVASAGATEAIAGELPHDAGGFERWLAGGFRSLGYAAPSLLSGLAGAGLGGTLGLMGASTAGSSYTEARSQGVDPLPASAYAAAQGIIEAATELIPMRVLFGDVAKRSGFFKAFLHQQLTEQPTEQVATHLQAAVDYAMLPANKDKTWRDYWQEFPERSAATAVATLVAAGGQTMIAYGARRLVERLGETAAESKTLGRSPEKLAEFLAAATAGTAIDVVHLPIQTFTEFFQDRDENPAEVAVRLTGDARAYDEARRSGHELAVPMAQFVTQIMADPERAAFFAQEARLAPGLMNTRELDAEIATATATADTAAAAEATPTPTPGEGIAADVTAQLVAAGFTPADAATNAAIVRAGFETLATRLGLDPRVLYDRYRLKVTRETMRAAAVQGAGAVPERMAPAPDLSGLEDPPAADLSLSEEAWQEARRRADEVAQNPTAATRQQLLQASGVLQDYWRRAVRDGNESLARSLEAEIQYYDLLMKQQEEVVLRARGATISPDATPAAAVAGSGSPDPGAQPRAAAQGGAPDARGDAARAQGSRPRAVADVPAGVRGHFDTLLTDAKALGFAGTDDQLAALYLAQVDAARQVARELADEVDDNIPTSRDLLKAVAAAGGLGIEAEGEHGMVGELEDLLESLNKGTKRTAVIRRGKRAGTEVKLPPLRTGGLKGIAGIVVRKGGKAVDRVRETINEDARWSGQFENLADFLEAVRDAIMIELGVRQAPEATTFNVLGVLEGALGVQRGARWWDPAAPLTDAPAPSETADEGDGDTSFNVDEFEAAVDTLATGEQQPRLPGDVGAVRDVEVVQPPIAEADDVFRLSAPDEAQPAGQGGLDLGGPSGAYLEAQHVMRSAEAAFTEATRQFRAREIDDAAYLAARQTHDAARAVFEAAFAREQQRASEFDQVVEHVAEIRALTDRLYAAGWDVVGWGDGRVVVERVDDARGTGRRTQGEPSKAAQQIIDAISNYGEQAVGTALGWRVDDGAGGATLAREGNAPYQQDLFGAALEGPLRSGAEPPADGSAGPTRGDVLAGADLQLDETTGTYKSRTSLVASTIRQLGVGQISNVSDAAHAAANLAKSPVERFDAIVTNAHGVPIAVVGAFKGAVDQAPAYPSALVSEAVRVKGAAGIWFAHNHPSGSGDLSGPDLALWQKLINVFDGSGVRPEGLLVVAAGEEGQREWQGVTSSGTQKGTLRVTGERVDVPVLEREIVSTERFDMAPIVGPIQAKAVARQIAGDQFGVVLLDTRWRPIGFVPLDAERATELRGGDLGRLFRGVSMGVTQAALIVAPAGGTAAGRAAALNVANALHAINVTVLDIVSKDGDRYVSFDEDVAERPIELSGLFRQDRRGTTQFTGDAGGRRINIKLFEAANLSTLLHETGHLFLEVFGDVADAATAIELGARTPEQQRLVDDYDALLGELGVDRARFRTMLSEHAAISTRIRSQHREPTAAEAAKLAELAEPHERFARLYEAYLREGKAPSANLRGAFARFRAWLVSLYRSLTSLRVNLTPEVRGILARLHASDQAIAEVEAEATVAPLFTNAETVGMTPEAFADYQRKVAAAATTARDVLEDRLLSEVRREQTTQYQAARTRVEAEVTAAVDAEPAYQALAAIQRGTRPDGTPLVEGEDPAPLKLSRAILVARYGEGFLKTLPRPYLYTVDGGLDPDVVATEFGFSSGDELLKALIGLPARSRAIRSAVDRRMLEEFGSLLIDGTLPERAREAVANAEHDDVLRVELTTLATLAGLRTAAPAPAQLRQMVEARIASARAGFLRPQTYWVAARRHSKVAAEAAAKRDYPVAIAAKQQEIVNLALYREAVRTQDEVERMRAALDKFTEKPARARLGLAGESYLDQVDSILERYDLAPATQKDARRKQSLADWILAREREGLPVDLPLEVLDEARRAHWRNITVDELRGVHDGVQHIAHLARLKRRLLKAEDDRDFDETVAGLVASADAHRTRRKLPIENDRAERRRFAVDDWFASHTKIATFIRALDGGQDGGPWWTAIMRVLNEAADSEAVRKIEAGRRYDALLATHYTAKERAHFADKTFVPAIGDSLSKDARLVVALYWGSEAGRERLLHDPRRAFTAAQVAAILDTLDARDFAFIRGLHTLLGEFFPESAEKERRVTGIRPEPIEPLPFETRHGRQPGGYFPIVYDSRLAQRAAGHEVATEATLQKQAAYVRATTKRGHLKDRVAHTGLPVKLELGTVFGHLESVIHDLTHHEALIDVTRLIRDRDIETTIKETLGVAAYQQFTGALEDIALGKLPPAQHLIDKAANFLRKRTQVAVMGWSLWTGLQQPLGLFNGMSRVGGRWVARGLGRWLRDAASLESTVGWIQARSDFMKARARTATIDLADLRSDYERAGGWFDTLLRSVTGDRLTQRNILDSYLWHIGIMQRVADVPTWLGQYEKSRAAGESEERAAKLADQAVIDSQGSAHIKDLAAVQRGVPTARLFTTFYSYGNVLYNQTADRSGRVRRRDPATIAKFLGHLSMLYVMPAFAIASLRVALGLDDDDEWLAEVGRETLAGALNTMVVVRELSALGFLAFEGEARGVRGYAGPAALRPLASFYRFAAQARQGEVDEALVKALNELAGIFFPYPAKQVERTVDGVIALGEGRTSNPAAVFVGPPREE